MIFRSGQGCIKYDRKIIVEEMITGREIECSVLGNENPASIPGEILVHDEFIITMPNTLMKAASMSIPQTLMKR